MNSVKDRARSVLVVEDEWLIAEMISGELRDAGYAVVGPAPTTDRALALIAQGGVDAAVLDVNLNGAFCYALADALDARKIPYLFLTGYIRRDLPSAFRDRPMLPKPLSPDALHREVAALLAA